MRRRCAVYADRNANPHPPDHDQPDTHAHTYPDAYAYREGLCDE